MELRVADTPRGAWVRALERTAPYGRGDGASLPQTVAAIAAQQGAQPALLGEDVTLSYAELARRMNGVAHWAVGAGLASGDVVGLLLPNCPDYVALWLGIASVRGVAALLNPNLVGEALLHAITVAGPRHLVVDAAFAPAVELIRDRLPPDLRLWGFGDGASWQRVDCEIAALPATAPDAPPPALADLALLIYTSGTTGLPKAARVSHRRVAEWSGWFAGIIDTRPDDRMYNCLPLYHSVGGVVAIGAMLASGGSVLIRPRFSATRFWDDIVEHDCTLFQYIGELCRYLLNSRPHPQETRHRLRLCCGNGMRADVWEKFQARFAIPRILEFYAATEGNISLYNVEGRPGAIGRVPRFLAHRFPIALVRCDPDTLMLARGSDGLCIPCRPGEPGEALGRIGEAGRPFEGYTSGEATEAKIARDVVAPSDAWFRTGDLMRRDAAGFYYFIDRLGNTFRWKGENVATEEVAAALRACPGVTQAVVYGVPVAGAEGRAGMAALVVTETFDLGIFQDAVEAALPDYARPVFLRLCTTIASTATFKPATAQLTADGYDPTLISEPLFLRDHATGAYQPLDQASFARLCGGDLRC